MNRSFAIEDPQLRDFGDAAVAIAVLAQETSWQGNDNSGRFRITIMAVRADDRWLLVHVHIGPPQLPPGAPTAPGSEP